MVSPTLILAPSATLISSTVPAKVTGISIEALSVSSTIRLSPSANSSPTLTDISITSTSAAPPKSGTKANRSDSTATASAITSGITASTIADSISIST